jgi:DNA modification methylase
MLEFFLDRKIALHCGNCLDVLAKLDECSLDSCVTDPPYHLLSIVKRFGAEDAAPVKQRFPYGCNFKEENGGTGAAMARLSRGFMGKVWDGGDIAFDPETWRAVFRVLKPGAHLLAMGGTRTYHRLACAIEDAGFEIRDTISWLYGSGFPKSHDVSKGIDKAAGALGNRGKGFNAAGEGGRSNGGDIFRCDHPDYAPYQPATDAARQWAGWGTALKPACELIVLARKPLNEATVAANALRWGTGAINVDGCRVGTTKNVPASASKTPNNIYGAGMTSLTGGTENSGFDPNIGRWPANVIHDGSEEVTAAFPDVHGAGYEREPIRAANATGMFSLPGDGQRYGDSGSASRFFYTAKADSDDRLGSKHPTVKPLDLMQYLVRLVTSKGGTCLDPFAGTGTTGEAAWREGMRAVLIEREAEYQADIRRRMALVLAGPDERAREAIKAKNLPRNDGPLFDWKEVQ